MSLTTNARNRLGIGLADPATGAEVADAIDASILAGGDPAALHSLSGNGIVAKTSSTTSTTRTITGTANQITVTNGDGVAGAPTLSLPVTIDITTSYKVNGTKVLGAQGAAVIDATDDASAITQLNALLARCRAHGLIA